MLVFIFVSPPSGAELLVEQLSPGAGDQKKENPNVFLVGSTRQRLLSGAEDVGLFKEYNDGSMRGFTCANKHNFTDFKGKVMKGLHQGIVRCFILSQHPDLMYCRPPFHIFIS